MSAKTGQKAIDVVRGTLGIHPNVTVKELVQLTGLGHSTVGKQLVFLEAEGSAIRIRIDRKSPETWSLPKVETAEEEVDIPTGAGKTQDRLGKGELRTMVLDYLTNSAGESFTPSAVGKALRRSSGAIANALSRLASEGQIAQVDTRPRRWVTMGHQRRVVCRTNEHQFPESA